MRDSMIHELVRSYRSGRASGGAVIERVAGLLYRSPRRFGFDDEDEAAEALERHGNRILALADRFQERGVDFEVYLRTSLRYLARTIRRQRRRTRDRERLCEEEASSTASSAYRELSSSLATRSGEGRGGEPASFTRGAAYLITSKKRALAAKEVAALSSRIVFLALKCAWDLDDGLADRVAEAAGVDSSWLVDALAQARRSLEPERCRFERLVAWRNSSWCRLRCLEAQAAAELDEARRSELREALARERSRLERARTEIAAFRPTVPNSVVARILGVPKGTVDSGLYFLMRRSRSDEGGARGEEGADLALAPPPPVRVSSRDGTLRRDRQRP